MYVKEPGKEMGKVMNYEDILRVIRLTVSEMDNAELLKEVVEILNERIGVLTHLKTKEGKYT